MVITHLSHYGLETLGQTTDSIVLEGTLANCKRMAFAHGLEITRSNTRLLSFNGSYAVYSSGDYVSYELTDANGLTGLIQKTRDGWALVMPLKLWEEQV
jgi:hypothetical protein